MFYSKNSCPQQTFRHRGRLVFSVIFATVVVKCFFPLPEKRCRTMLPTLLLIVCQLTSTAWGSETPVPPSTFPSVSSTATAPSDASSSTSASASNSTTATPTSSAQFPSLSGYSACGESWLLPASSKLFSLYKKCRNAWHWEVQQPIAPASSM